MDSAAAGVDDVGEIQDARHQRAANPATPQALEGDERHEPRDRFGAVERGKDMTGRQPHDLAVQLLVGDAVAPCLSRAAARVLTRRGNRSRGPTAIRCAVRLNAEDDASDLPSSPADPSRDPRRLRDSRETALTAASRALSRPVCGV